MEEKIYEMLWDCQYCQTKKLLGKTHRFCPSCGAPQDPEKRYFPAENEKVAVQDHIYHGADMVCGACKNAMSAKMEFCGACGSPLQGSRTVKLVHDGPASAPPPPAPSKEWNHLLPLGAGLAAAAGIAMLFMCTKPVTLTVEGHSWTREIQIEKFGPKRESDWCDSMPYGARELSRSRRTRSHRSVPDGEDCRTVKRDRGDGTYAEKEVCTPRTRKEPVEASHCEYEVEKWSHDGAERSQGAGLLPEPYWPEVRISRPGQCVGCRREGPRREAYTVSFSEGGKTHSCDIPQERWSAMPPGTRWKGEKRMTGTLVCSGFSRAE